MNPFIRLCGLKCHHGLRDLISRTGRLGSMTYRRCRTKKPELVARALAQQYPSQNGLLLPVDLRQARVKSAMGSLLSMLESR